MERGTAVATVSGGQLSGAVESEVAETVTTLFRVRAMQIDRRFTLADQANVVEHRRDKQHVVLRVQESVVVRDRLDVQITEVATGAIIKDTKAERIKAEEAELATLSAQSQRNSTLRTMLASYTSAINDPANALTQLRYATPSRSTSDQRRREFDARQPHRSLSDRVDGVVYDVGTFRVVLSDPRCHDRSDAGAGGVGRIAKQLRHERAGASMTWVWSLRRLSPRSARRFAA